LSVLYHPGNGSSPLIEELVTIILNNCGFLALKMCLNLSIPGPLVISITIHVVTWLGHHQSDCESFDIEQSVQFCASATFLAIRWQPDLATNSSSPHCQSSGIETFVELCPSDHPHARQLDSVIDNSPPGSLVFTARPRPLLLPFVEQLDAVTADSLAPTILFSSLAGKPNLATDSSPILLLVVWH
jgi:hypothetical protein